MMIRTRSFCLTIMLFISVLVLTFTEVCTTTAEERAVFKGQVIDAEGDGVEGAMVFVYDSPQVRRPGDFISGHTGTDGMFKMTIPPGRYWAVARLKRSGDYGPLMPGDKHSGDPVEIELDPGSEIDMEFTVTDLQEAVEIRREERERPVRISGRIIDDKGSPIRNAYAIASKHKNVNGIPDYLSTWVDDNGRYTLYVPAGKYFIGGAVSFPPEDNAYFIGEMEFDENRNDLDIVIRAQTPVSK